MLHNFASTTGVCREAPNRERVEKEWRYPGQDVCGYTLEEWQGGWSHDKAFVQYLQMRPKAINKVRWAQRTWFNDGEHQPKVGIGPWCTARTKEGMKEFWESWDAEEYYSSAQPQPSIPAPPQTPPGEEGRRAVSQFFQDVEMASAEGSASASQLQQQAGEMPPPRAPPQVLQAYAQQAQEGPSSGGVMASPRDQFRIDELSAIEEDLFRIAMEKGPEQATNYRCTMVSPHAHQTDSLIVFFTISIV